MSKGHMDQWILGDMTGNSKVIEKTSVIATTHRFCFSSSEIIIWVLKGGLWFRFLISTAHKWVYHMINLHINRIQFENKTSHTNLKKHTLICLHISVKRCLKPTLKVYLIQLSIDPYIYQYKVVISCFVHLKNNWMSYLSTGMRFFLI